MENPIEKTWLDLLFERSFGNNAVKELAEYDNLYVDVNAVLRLCLHPEGKPAPAGKDVFRFIFEYIDNLFSLVHPRKLLYLAVDGVAPRSLMNQQRSQMFVAAKYAPEDYDVTAPGTEFVASLSEALQRYIHARLSQSPSWQNIEVILSDSKVPGMGKHKIMSYIRLQRNLPHFSANTRHCLYGATQDPDYILLSLATHEIHFSILREFRFSPGEKQPVGSTQRKRGHLITDSADSEKKYKLFHIWLMREQLQSLMATSNSQTGIERIIDDFLFLSLLVGNDFLPPLPAPKNQKFHMGILMMSYKENFADIGGYLTAFGEVVLARAERFFYYYGKQHNVIPCMRQRQHQLLEPGCEGTGLVREKFGETQETRHIKEDVVMRYMEGLCWVYRLYHHGFCAWRWYYPYRYAPMALDLTKIEGLEIIVLKQEPFKPFDQLMVILPAARSRALPEAYQMLMTDRSSPISEFYPADFQIDNWKDMVHKPGQGEKISEPDYPKQSIARIPFVKEAKLLNATRNLDKKLTKAQKKRNTSVIYDLLFVHKSHPLGRRIQAYRESPFTPCTLGIDASYSSSQGMNGRLLLTKDNHIQVDQLERHGLPRLTDYDEVLNVAFLNPAWHFHSSELQEGVNIPDRILPGFSIVIYDN